MVRGMTKQFYGTHRQSRRVHHTGCRTKAKVIKRMKNNWTEGWGASLAGAIQFFQQRLDLFLEFRQ